MKHFIITLLVLGTSFFANNAAATVRTVNNANPGAAQYSSITAALAASAPNDVIMVQGSSVSYGDITIDKAISLIGTGHRPSKQMPLVSTVGIITFGNNVSNVGISGFKITGVIYANNNNNLININGCYINSTVLFTTSNNIILKNNIMGVINCGGNMLIESNVLNQLSNANSGVQLSNNLIFVQYYGFEGGDGTIFEKNIFVKNATNSGYYVMYGSNCSYTNNVTYATNPSYPLNLPNGNGNILANNWQNTDPQFENVVFSSGLIFSYSHNYRLKTTSPVYTAGVGLYGAGSPFSMTGEPPIAPVIRSMSISNSSGVPANGSLNVSFSATKAN